MIRKILLVSLLTFLAFSCSVTEVIADVAKVWVKKYASTYVHSASLATCIDSKGNVFMGGARNRNFLTIKYDQNGIEKWVRTYTGLVGDDFVTSLAIDSSGNVYACGLSEGIGSSRDIFIIKYDTAGNTIWTERFSSPGSFDDMTSMAMIDHNGDLVIGGTYGGNSGSGLTDFVTLKYDSSGNKIWSRTYNGVGNGDDGLGCMTVDDLGNVYVAGDSKRDSIDFNMTLLKYDVNGNLLFQRSYNELNNSFETPNDLAADNYGNIFVCGGSGSPTDYYVLKYDSNGNLLWKGTYNGTVNHNDDASDLAVDNIGNVYITGHSRGENYVQDIVTVKFSSSGLLLWAKRYRMIQANATSYGNDIVVDNDGNAFVTGTIGNLIVSLKYDSSGEQIWANTLEPDLVYGFRASSHTILIDTLGNVVVGGNETNGSQTNTIAMKLAQVVRVNIKAIVQGHYNQFLSRLNVRDTMKVFLREAVSPYRLVDSSFQVIDSLNFSSTYQFNNTPGGRYFLIVLHRNSIETWSKAGGMELYPRLWTYDFTNFEDQAYGNNIVLVGSKYCIYSGDVNQDQIVDGTDFSMVDNDAYSFSTGYLQTDLTGNNFVDATDLAIVHNNARNFVSVIHP